MVAQRIEQSIHTVQSVSFRVLTAIKLMVLANEDVKRMDFGMEKSFLAKVRIKISHFITLF